MVDYEAWQSEEPKEDGVTLCTVIDKGMFEIGSCTCNLFVRVRFPMSVSIGK